MGKSRLINRDKATCNDSVAPQKKKNPDCDRSVFDIRIYSVYLTMVNIVFSNILCTLPKVLAQKQQTGVAQNVPNSRRLMEAYCQRKRNQPSNLGEMLIWDTYLMAIIQIPSSPIICLKNVMKMLRNIFPIKCFSGRPFLKKKQGNGK